MLSQQSSADPPARHCLERPELRAAVANRCSMETRL
jgi:hypothetical protein